MTTLTCERAAGARVDLLCSGGGCAFARRRIVMHGASRVALARAFRGTRLRAGAAVQVRVTVPDTGVVLVRFVMRRGKPPRKERTFIATTTGPAPAPPSPAPGPAPPPSPGAPPPAASRSQQALAIAEQYLGTPFVYGGASPATGFDDGGLVQYAYGQVGVALPRVAADQFTAGAPVAMADLRPGDLVLFEDLTAYINHVGLYAGNGQFLHAPHTGDVIRYSSLSEPYYAHSFAGARRVADSNASDEFPLRRGLTAHGAEHENVVIARSIIDANLYMTLGTADADGSPWATPVYFAHTEYREFVWISAPGARHSRNIAQRPQIGIVIFDSQVPINTGQAVYIEAHAYEAGGRRARACGRDVSARAMQHEGLPFSAAQARAPARHRLYRATAAGHYVLGERDERIAVDLRS